MSLALALLYLICQRSRWFAARQPRGRSFDYTTMQGTSPRITRITHEAGASPARIAVDNALGRMANAQQLPHMTGEVSEVSSTPEHSV